MRILIVTVPLPSAEDPTTMAPLARQIKSLQAEGVQVDTLEMKGIPKVKYLKAIKSLQQLAAPVDLIHAHYGYCGWLARCQFGKPVVVSFMGSDLFGTPMEDGRIKLLSRLTVYIDRWFAHTVDRVIVKSSEMANVIKPVKAHIVPNGVDTNAFRPMDKQQAKKALGWTTNLRYILFPGNPDNPRKQFSLANSMVTKASNIIGEQLELVPLWRVMPDKVPLYMNACDAMTMTSYIEGSPNVVKEAMACDLPVVSVPVGDVTELFDGVSGYTVCARDEDELAKNLAQTLTIQHSVEGRLAIDKKGLDLASIAKTLINIYREVLEEYKKLVNR